MMNILSRLSWAMLLLLGGCAVVGNGAVSRMSRGEMDHAIKVGHSTKADIAAAFGDSHVFKFDSGYEIWVYRDQQSVPTFVRYIPIIGTAALFVPDRSRELVLLFGSDGVLRKYRLHQSQG
ncbi:hypothetical protein ACFOLJ_07705 [Rugamonas sp. CCM 8940]|uniref:hypothetical protein n=1 Tax=Rugamonas sp. CCM 8940 TaxID=2765359 RepID=UPI0018F3438A|nr:hypothetical protein [Rugamonas sp. CCM 8940]MBJ7310162.1 hypothetical protein [Rugamonas sp. CCM 8940]